MHVILLSLLLFVASPAWAEWVKVAEDPDATYYVDAATIRSDGNLRRAWQLQDYAKPEAGGVRSRRVWYEFDCTGERMRRFSIAEHAEPMGGGSALATSDRQTDWVHVGARTGSRIAPATPFAQTLRFVCSR